MCVGSNIQTVETPGGDRLLQEINCKGKRDEERPVNETREPYQIVIICGPCLAPNSNELLKVGV